MQVFIKILKIISGIILGLVFSFVTIVCLEILLPKPNPFRVEGLNLWLVGPIIAAWVFFMLWLLLRSPSSRKIRTQGIEHLPESIAELIDGIIDVMKYRRSVRADVRQELVDHFTDALAYCENEFEKQKRIGELVAEFGDIKLLGALIRRGKKRCRPLWRTMVARTFQFIGICFLLLIFYIGWFFTGKPIVTTNYLEILNQQVRPVADDSQNAWPFYEQAAEKRVEYEDEDQNFDFSPRTISTLSEQERQIIQRSISDNRESLELIRLGNQKPYYWKFYGTDENENYELMSVLLPHLSDYKKLMYLLYWRGFFSAEKGNYENAFHDLLEVYSFGQHLRGQKTTLIEQLVAMAIEGMSMNTLQIVLAEYTEQIDAALLNSVRQRFSAMIDDKDFTADYDTEKLAMYDEVQRSFTESRFGKSHLYLPRLREFGTGPRAGGDDIVTLFFILPNVLFTHPDKEQTLEDVERFYSEMEKVAEMTPASVNSQGLDIDQTAQEIVKRNIFLGILLPALGRVNQMAWRSRAESYATLVILAVKQYEKETGQLPESLDVLIDKGLLKKVPIDPFSDKPLVYKKTEDGFTLYSVGENFKDDGGVPGEYKGRNKKLWTNNGDAVFWPVQPVSSQQ